MTVEETLYHIHDQFIQYSEFKDMKYNNPKLWLFVTTAMAKYAAEKELAAAELSWDAAIDYARECADWSVSKNALVDRETYLKKYNV